MALKLSKASALRDYTTGEKIHTISTLPHSSSWWGDLEKYHKDALREKALAEKAREAALDETTIAARHITATEAAAAARAESAGVELTTGTTFTNIISDDLATNQDSIGKRILAAIEQITRAVEDGTVTLEAGEFALMILVESVSHFAAPDVNRLASDVLKAYRIQIKEIAAAAEADKVVAITAPADVDAW